MADLLRLAPVEYDLLKENRFELIFPSDIGLESWMCHSADKPKLTIDSIELPYMNTKYFTSGHAYWEEMTFEIINFIGPSTTQGLMEWVRLHFESLSGRMGYAKGFMKDLILRSLDPNGAPVEQWILEKCFITKSDFGKHDYGTAEAMKVTFTVQPQRCVNSY